MFKVLNTESRAPICLSNAESLWDVRTFFSCSVASNYSNEAPWKYKLLINKAITNWSCFIPVSGILNSNQMLIYSHTVWDNIQSSDHHLS